MVHQHPLRSNPNVLAFANKPVSYVNDTMVEMLRPIESMPVDMPEAAFARVRFLGNEYWITSDPGEDTVMVGGEYVVVEKGEGDTKISQFSPFHLPKANTHPGDHPVRLRQFNYRPYSELRPPLVPPTGHSVFYTVFHLPNGQDSESSPNLSIIAPPHANLHQITRAGTLPRVTRQDAKKERTLWKGHVNRVIWLKWYWVQTSPELINRFRGWQEEAKKLRMLKEKEREERVKRLEATIEDAMDIDVDEEVQLHDVERQDRYDGIDGHKGKERKERTFNEQGEDDPEGLTEEQWEIVKELEETIGAEELASAAGVAVDRRLKDVIQQSWI
ncbi:MAG: hypothetical protein Q9182_000234 [Xanthomendoza sp. 2 TL-2023]